MCKLKEHELLEPLVPSVRQCLEHRYPYVRKNAVLAIYAIHKNFDFLIPDAAELVYEYLAKETDLGCRRNAFIMLMNTDMTKALSWLQSVWSQVPTFDENMQLAVIEFIRKDCRSPGADKPRYVQAILNLVQSPSSAVRYEAAGTLVSLTSHTSAVKAAAGAYIDLAVKEADNNVKLICLDRLKELHDKFDHVLDDLVMDILRVLTSPDIEVRRKCILIAMDLVSSRNVDEVVQFLKKELAKTHDAEYEKNTEYRHLLIQAVHACAIKHSEVASNVVHVLMEFVADSTQSAAVDVIAFVREVMERFPHLRPGIIQKLLDSFSEIKAGRVYRGALWILGEYCLTQESIEGAFSQLRKAIGEVPIVAAEQRLLDEANQDKEEVPQEVKAAPKMRVLADGTYATESALASKPSGMKLDDLRKSQKPPLRALIMSGDYFLGAVLATCLTKLVLRYAELCSDESKVNALRAEAMLIMTSIIRVGKSDFVNAHIDEDSADRISMCLRTLANVPDDELMKQVFLEDSRKAFAQLVAIETTKNAEKKEGKKQAKVQVDDVISCRFLKSKRALADGTDEFDADVSKATGGATGEDFIRYVIYRIY